jgi:phosphoribosylaminoimidazolecarboxamide formyltransferase / IMP cyclohydrolase
MNRPIRRALVSVSDKTGLVEFARKLAQLGVEIVSTGGTAKALAEAGLAVTDVSTVTGFPEIMDGRVKTLHPRIHGGILARRGLAGDVAAQGEHGIGDIDLVVVNLYPFEDALAGDRPHEELIETIDIGGPALIRAAAKNHDSVTVIADPADYLEVAAEMLAGNGATRPETRRALAAKAFARTAAYDSAVSGWLFADKAGGPAPAWRALGGRLKQTLRYGENPHQGAAFYVSAGPPQGLAAARQVQGKELSYNNINDADGALECVAEFDPAHAAACVIVKHANPCGAAVAPTLLEAYRLALRCDPVSAYGGIVAFNRPLDVDTAAELAQIFTEVIIAPGAEPAALEALQLKPNLRVLLSDGLPDPRRPGLDIRTVAGGFLVQSRDAGTVADPELRTVTRRAPSARELADLQFAFRVVKHVKSNAIVYARNGATIGIGAGQMSRVDSSRIATWKSGEASRAAGLEEPLAIGSVVASDAFFPFPDGVLEAVAAGATAVIQPGGSLRDQEVIRAADEAGLAMVFTGMRHFRH